MYIFLQHTHQLNQAQLILIQTGISTIENNKFQPWGDKPATRHFIIIIIAQIKTTIVSIVFT